MKTNELTGPALNWAVRYALNGRKPVDYVEARDNFSTCWNKCGPIIEREEISIRRWKFDNGGWVAMLAVDGEGTEGVGPTPLIAAMRCFVALKLGDEVDVPEELT